jgi:hypothetical protein
MHLYLRLVNESGDPLVEQVPEAGFHSEEVGFDICGTQHHRQAPEHTTISLCFTNIIHLSLMLCALSTIGFG